MRLRAIACVCLWGLPRMSFAAEASPPSDPGALYAQALRAMNAKDYGSACPTLEQVTRAAPTGLGAKFTLAECYEESGRLASAYEMFLLVERETGAKGQAERREKSAARAAALESRLARLTIVAPPSLASGFGIHVTLDDTAIDSSKWGTARFVDAGTHRIVVDAKSGGHWEQQIEIADGETKEVAVRDIVGLPAREVPPQAVRETSGSANASMAAESPKAAGGFPVWQVVTGGVGLVAIGAGIAFALDSRAAETRIVEHCGETLICKRETGYDPAEDNARKNRGFGLFVGLTGAGAVAIGTATVGMIMRRSGKKAPTSGFTMTPIWSPEMGGAIVGGRF
jgi:hypothetical protein